MEIHLNKHERHTKVINKIENVMVATISPMYERPKS